MKKFLLGLILFCCVAPALSSAHAQIVVEQRHHHRHHRHYRHPYRRR